MSSTLGTTNNNAPTLAVIGGGLAGIAAAEAAKRSGYRVTLFERSGVLGGRAASMFEPVSGNWIDNGQHLVMGCCTELLDLHRRLDLSRFFERQNTIPFTKTNGTRWILAPTPILPPSLQLLPALLRMPALSFTERWQLGRQVRKLCRETEETTSPKFVDWLESEKVSNRTVADFWVPLILSSLGETFENVGCQAVRKVIRDGFLAGGNAMCIHVPTAPLRDIYHNAVQKKFEKMGIALHPFSRVRKIVWELPDDDHAPQVTALELADGSRRTFDAYIMAVPSYRIWEILNASDLEDYAEQLGLDRFEPGAITTLHLWFDRRLLPSKLTGSALLGGPGQFLFCPAREKSDEKKIPGVYHTVVISASHRLLSDGELTAAGCSSIVDRVIEQLKDSFPEMFHGAPNGTAKLLHRRVTTYFDAVFSPNSTVYLHRPEQMTPFSNLALAGDWTQTFWPATMEGAVRSGRLAVEALNGVSKSFRDS